MCVKSFLIINSKKFILSYALLPSFLFSACSLVERPNPSPAHYIMVDKEGHPINRDDKGLNYQDFQAQYLDPIMAGIDQRAKGNCNKKVPKDPLRVLIFVHGGLNAYESGLGRVEDMVRFEDQIQKKGGSLLGSCFYPVFIVWNSSLMSSWLDDLFIIRRGVSSPWWVSILTPVTAPFVAGTRAAEGLLGVYPALPHMAKDNWDGFTRNMPDEEKNNQEAFRRTLLGASFFTFLLPRLTTTWPLIKATGTPAWEMMKRRADLVMATKILRNRYAKEGAVRTFIAALKKRIASEEAGVMWKIDGSDERKVPLEISLVGHSMGTLILDRMLQAFQEVHFKRIIYMASASSIDDVESSVIPYLKKHADSEFWAFTLSRGDEARDVYFKWIDPIDTGSLLVYIDNFFEETSNLGDLRFGRYSNLEESNFPYLGTSNCSGELKICIVKFKGNEDEPKSHGDFSEPFILENKILRRVNPDAFPLPDSKAEKMVKIEDE